MQAKSLIGSLVLSAGLAIGSTQAQQFTVEITNLTQGIYFTPLLIAAHDNTADIFQTGQAASVELQAMAEGGDISGLSNLLNGIAIVEENPAAGLLAPGSSTTTATIDTEGTDYDRLSIVAMMLPTNDGFVGLDAWSIPETAGTYVIHVNAYDAGTEANDEIIGSGAPGEAGFPAPGPVATASGTGGTGINTTVEGFVHIHRGVLGDLDNVGGQSDIDRTVHRWLNPVARITIVVQ